ncbi:helix-turn-helix domain-containing protein [Palleronia sp. LCG004]|uniref:helix-turn-helix domain-containing protein n=1 Tax=Palleronia sp. LCG004 TaxID=3079304 RepID=UPI00397B138F
MPAARPLTPEILANRWQCSAETVRQLVRSGQLRGFRVGRMIRIPVDAVEDYECPKLTSDASEAGSASTGPIQSPANEHGVSLRHAPERKRSLRR